MRCNHNDMGDHELGFTLFESIAALTILSMAFVALFSAHTSAIKSTAAAEDFGKARIIAESLLADATTGWGFPLNSASGRTDVFDWTIEIDGATGQLAAIDAKTPWKLVHVRVKVAWQPARHVELETYKLVKARSE